MTEDMLAALMYQSAIETRRAFREAKMVDHVATDNAPRGRRTGHAASSRVEDYRRCAAEGLTRRQTADRLGVSDDAVTYMVKVHGVTFRPARVKK